MLEQLYEEMFRAEHALEAELKRRYGDDASEARYDYSRNGMTFDSGDPLRIARDAYVAAHSAYFPAYRASLTA